jgi:hypothetical protein
MGLPKSYFWHGSYSGNNFVPNDLLETYTRTILKLEFLRARLSDFGTAFEDEKYFKAQVNKSKLQMLVFAMGGEASSSPESALITSFGPVADDLTTFVIPKAGHWIVNSVWLGCYDLWLTACKAMRTQLASANRVMQFLEGGASMPNVHLELVGQHDHRVWWV